MGKKHDLLIDDGQLLILEVSLAVLIGDRQAIALQQIHYWTEINRKAEKETHFFEGKWWVYNTWNEWRNGNKSNDPNFPFWSIATIRRVFDDLQKMKLIITRQHEERNKGLWVAIDYDVLHGLTKSADGSAQNEQTGLRKMSRRSRQNAQTTSTTETTETTTETTSKPDGKVHFSKPDMDAMAEAIRIAFQWETPNKNEWGQISRAAYDLLATPITPNEVLPLYRHCKKQFSIVKPTTLAGNVSEWRKTVQHSRPAAPVEPAPYDGDDVVILPDNFFQGITK